MQNFGDLVQEKHFQVGGLMEEVGNSMKNQPYLGNGERYG